MSLALKAMAAHVVGGLLKEAHDPLGQPDRGSADAERGYRVQDQQVVEVDPERERLHPIRECVRRRCQQTVVEPFASRGQHRIDRGIVRCGPVRRDAGGMAGPHQLDDVGRAQSSPARLRLAVQYEARERPEISQ